MKLFGEKKKRIVAADLGSRSFKVAEVEREGENFALLRFGVKPVPIQPPDKRNSKELATVLKELLHETGLRAHNGVAVISSRQAFLRLVDMPQMPLAEIRQALKTNSLRYLHQDCSNFSLDCQILPATTAAKPVADPNAPSQPTRFQVLVGAAPRVDVQFYRDVMHQAGLAAQSLGLSSVAVLNAFEVSQKEVFAKESVALIDTGYMGSTLFILHRTVPVLTRALQFGGQRLVSVVMRALNLDEAKAEQETLKMSEPGLRAVVPVLDDFAKEIRASFDFFEHQYQVQATKVYFTGSSLFQPAILTSLEKKIGIPCLTWNPCQGLTPKLPPDQSSRLENEAPFLASVLGAALAATTVTK